MRTVETILCVVSDMHTGSSTALFPAGGFRGEGDEGNQVLPNDRQKQIHPIWTRLAGEVATARKGKRLIIVNLGDAIDGFHHGSMQESLFAVKDQCQAHVSLMSDFMKRVSFGKSDELYYVQGTEVHVGNFENDMARELGAKQAESGLFISDVMALNINGTLHGFAHHGKERGGGQNEGNALRNHLRDVRNDRERDGLPRLDALWSGHTHGHTWNTHIERRGGDFHVFHGIICPSFQAKTRYAYQKVPMAVNSVGGVWMPVSVDGELMRPRFVVGVTADR